MKRIFTILAGTLLLGTFISCSGTESVQETDRPSVTEEQTPYPSWYQEQTVVDADSVMLAYATAIDSDSSAAVSKAVAWAQTELAAFVAATLEDIRSEAGETGATDSGVNNPEFIFALAKNNAIQNLASITNTEVETVEGYVSHRSYAEVQISKDALIEAIATELNTYKKAWNTMKESQAFEEFAM